MKKTLKLCGLYLLVTLTVALGVIFLVPMSVTANNNEDWDDYVTTAADNHLLDIVGNLMNLHHANITADLAITTGEQTITLNADVALQASDGFADIAVAGDLAVRVNDFATALHLTYLGNTIYVDWNNLHLSVSTTDLIDGLPTILALFGVEFTMPDMSDLDVNAILAMLENYTEADNGNGYDVVLTVAGCDLQLTCDTNFNLQRAVIPDLTIGGATIAGDIALTTYDTTEAITVPDFAYVDVPQLVKLFGDLIPTFNQPFAISGNATLYATENGNPQLDNYLNADLGRLAVATRDGLLDQLAIEIAVNGMGDLFNTTLGGRALDLGAYFNSNNTDGGVYLNFDGLKLFCAKADLADTYAALQNLLGLFIGDDVLQYTNLFYFNDNNDMVFDRAVLTDLMGDLSANDIVTMLNTYLPYLQGLTLTADNVLTITLANDLLTLELRPTADGVYELNIHSYLAAQNREIVAELTLQTVDAFTGEPTDTTGYLDVSDIDDLLNAVNNTVRHQEFAFTGNVKFEVNIIGIKVNKAIPVTILINNTDPERGLVVTAHLALPYDGMTKLMLDSAPDAAGSTQNGTRDVYLYYQQGYIYLYRTEQVKYKEQVGTTLGFIPKYEDRYVAYEKAVKLTMAEFMDDALNWLLKWGFGFSDSIMTQITDAITGSNDNDDPLDYGDIIHGFTNTDGRFDIVLNLGEIAHNPDLKDFTVSVTTATDANGQTTVTAIGVDLQINVGVSMALKTEGNGLTLTTGDGVADITDATNHLADIDRRYTEKPLANGQTYYETIKGVWQAA